MHCLHAGFGLEKTKTTIFLVPMIMRVLDEYFLPLTEYLDLYGKLTTNERTWGETNERTWGEIACGYIPTDSALFTLKPKIDRDKHIDETMVSRFRLHPTDEGDLSSTEFGEVICDFAVEYSRHTYLPTASPSSPDLLVMIPPDDKRITSGVMAKCIDGEMIEREIATFEQIISENEILKTRCHSVLLIFATRLKDEFKCQMRPVPSSSIKEVIIINLNGRKTGKVSSDWK